MTTEDFVSNTQNGLLLLEAASLGNLVALEKLISNGDVSVDFQHPQNGWSALHWAAKRNNTGVVEYLLKAGANPQLKNSSGKCAVELASYEPTIELFKKLVSTDIPTSSSVAPSTTLFIPNYLQAPVMTKELAALEKQIIESTPSSAILSPDTSECHRSPTEPVNLKEYFVYNDKAMENCLGSVSVDASCSTMISLAQAVQMQIDGVEGDIDSWQMFKYNEQRKIVVPINSKQMEMPVCQVLLNSDTIIVLSK